MISKKPLAGSLCGLLLLTLLNFSAPCARANVYPTNLKLNGGMASITTTQSVNVNISYVLNEAASAGVTVQIFAGTNALRTISVPGGSPGALRGTNNVVWDTHDNGGTEVTNGVYSVSVTAAAKGYTNWTQISPDSTNYYVGTPRGIAVNVNTNSPFYGRVLVGNAAGPNNAPVPGDNDGIIKWNADGSFADEGAYSTAGYPWADMGFLACPQKIRIGSDDRVYALDYNDNGTVVACDMLMSTNQIVLKQDPNYTNDLDNLGLGWTAMDVTDTGTTNGRIWLGAYFSGGGLGIQTWKMTTNGIADPTDNTGTPAVLSISPGSPSNLQYPSGGFMVDRSNNIFVSQKLDSGSGGSKAMLFPNWDGTTALSNASWVTPTGDDATAYAFDVALDSRSSPKYLACSLNGPAGIRVLNVADGSFVGNVSSGTNYLAVAWDNAGNLYAVGDSINHWRVFSPPGGTNRATTSALGTIQVITAQPPQITSITLSNGFVVILFTGAPTDTASTFTLRNASSLSGPYWDALNPTITQDSPGHFRAVVPITLNVAFYRVLRHGSPPPPAPQISDISTSGSIVTINFTAMSSDVPASFLTLSAPTPDGPFSHDTGASIITLSPGYFRATLPKPPVERFFTIVRS
jgi:hypothetical protein